MRAIARFIHTQVGRLAAIRRYVAGLNTKIHLVVDAHDMPLRVILQRVPELIARKRAL